MEERHLSLSEVAELMEVAERTVRRWIKSGRLKAYKPGRDYRIPESAVKDFIERSVAYPKAGAPSTSPKEAAEAGPSELSANDLSDLCGEIYAELQSVRETPAEELKTQAIADLDADLKEAQAALSTAIYRKGPPRLSEWSMQRVIRQRRQRAQQSDEDAASETG